MRLNEAIFRISAGTSIGSAIIRILNILPGLNGILESVAWMSCLIALMCYMLKNLKYWSEPTWEEDQEEQ